MNGIVYNIQQFSIDDGPGIRTTVFLKGCPLRCLWCSNPESQELLPEIGHRNTICTKCSKCIDICDQQAITINDKGVDINRQKCTNCGKCIDVCTVEALKFFGTEMSVDEVYRIIMKDIDYYRNSNGGVTVSGGEPLYQTDFIEALLKKCREADIHTCLDTCGYASGSALKKVLPYTSLVLFDIKHTDPAAHLDLTGKSNDMIMSNLDLIVASETPLIIRIPVITGLNDSESNFKSIAQKMLDSKLSRVNLLPYHRFGEGKYQMLDRQYKLADKTSPADEDMQRYKQIFESNGIECEIVIGG